MPRWLLVGSFLQARKKREKREREKKKKKTINNKHLNFIK
jgi:hypothetical protein